MFKQNRASTTTAHHQLIKEMLIQNFQLNFFTEPIPCSQISLLFFKETNTGAFYTAKWKVEMHQASVSVTYLEGTERFKTMLWIYP